MVQGTSSGFIQEASAESFPENDDSSQERVVSDRVIYYDNQSQSRVASQDAVVSQYLTESQKYLPKLRNIKAPEPYMRKVILGSSKPALYDGFTKKRIYVKTANLTPYRETH